MRPVRTVIESCSQMGIHALTLYAFSVENWKRPRTEIEMLWRLLRTYLRLELPEMMRQRIRMNAIGRLDALPPQVHTELLEVLAETVRQSRAAGESGHQRLRRTRGTGRRRESSGRKSFRHGEVSAESIDEAAISSPTSTPPGFPIPTC